ncbi:MAG: AmmeMemoRadiSam system protein B, partial [Candidatus ainarchaeum sp.]|nr:AmmeMemoRadiSam system protein B [Candidatus ainarchaeum sp.]
MTVRYPAAAGTFYPSEKSELREMINSFIESAEEKEIDGELRALVVPHAGYIYSGPVAAVGYKLLQKKKREYEKIVLIGPSHFTRFPGVAQSE